MMHILPQQIRGNEEFKGVQTTCARSSASSAWNCFTNLHMSLSSVNST